MRYAHISNEEVEAAERIGEKIDKLVGGDQLEADRVRPWQ